MRIIEKRQRRAAARAGLVGVVLLGASAITGCAAIVQRPGFAEVEGNVDQRTGLSLSWALESPADAAISESVRGMLAEPLTAATAQQIALLNNRRMQAAYAQLGVSQAALVQASLPGNPVLDLGTERTVDGDDPQTDAALVVNLLDYLYRPLYRGVARTDFETAKAAVTAAAMDLAYETRTTFVRMQADEQLLEMRRQVLLGVEGAFAAAEGLFKAGNVSSYDVDQQRALLDQARMDVAVAETVVVSSREQLNRLMGLWGAEVSWRAAQRLPELPPTDLPTQDLETLAVERSIDLAMARLDIEAAGRRLGLTERMALIPELHAGPVVGREEGQTRVGLAVELPLPVFDRGQARSAADRARLQGQQAEYVALAVELRSQVREAGQQVLTAGRLARYHKEQILPLRQRITAQTLLRYNAMEIGVFQLLMAREQEIDAGAAYIESLRNYWLAQARLEQLLAGRMPAAMAMDLSTTTTPGTPGAGGH